MINFYSFSFNPLSLYFANPLFLSPRGRVCLRNQAKFFIQILQLPSVLHYSPPVPLCHQVTDYLTALGRDLGPRYFPGLLPSPKYSHPSFLKVFIPPLLFLLTTELSGVMAYKCYKILIEKHSIVKFYPMLRSSDTGRFITGSILGSLTLLTLT